MAVVLRRGHSTGQQPVKGALSLAYNAKGAITCPLLFVFQNETRSLAFPVRDFCRLAGVSAIRDDSGWQFAFEESWREESCREGRVYEKRLYENDFHKDGVVEKR